MITGEVSAAVIVAVLAFHRSITINVRRRKHGLANGFGPVPFL